MKIIKFIGTILLLVIFTACSQKNIQHINTEIKDESGNLYKTVVSPHTGKIWLDRNLGAKRVCLSHEDKECFGDYYQWGRNTDGHEKYNSQISTKISDTLNPNHNKYIFNDERWFKSITDDLWQGVNGKNNPCPKGFRIPTIKELIDETEHQAGLTNVEIFNDFLKLPSTGTRSYYKGTYFIGDSGSVWSSSKFRNYADTLFFNYDYTRKGFKHMNSGIPVRCIK